MRIWKGGCSECHGDLYLDYKDGSRWKCLGCHKYFQPGPIPAGAKVEGEKQVGKKL